MLQNANIEQHSCIWKILIQIRVKISQGFSVRYCVQINEDSDRRFYIFSIIQIMIVLLFNTRPYWFPTLIHVDIFLSFHECLLACAFYACLFVWVIFVYLYMYLSYFSSWVDYYRENPNLAMNTNHRKFSILSIPKLDLLYHQFQPSSNSP